jgi:hypothetical protein
MVALEKKNDDAATKQHEKNRDLLVSWMKKESTGTRQERLSKVHNA